MRALPLCPRVCSVAVCLLLVFAVGLLLLAPQSHAALINNGLAPPNPANVINDATYIHDHVYVRNVGCPPGWPGSGNVYDACPSPGDPTQVELTSDGVVGQNLFAYESSTVTLNGGAVRWHLYASGASTITLNAGHVGLTLLARDTATVTMNGGTVGGSGGHVQSEGASTITINGGGVMQNLYANDSSRIEIFGSGFAVNSSPVPYGDIVLGSGALTGTLASGEILSSYFYQGGGYGHTGTITLSPIPEPSTALLLGIGLAGLGMRRRQRTRRVL